MKRYAKLLLSLMSIGLFAVLPSAIGNDYHRQPSVPTTQAPDDDDPPEAPGYDTHPGKRRMGLDEVASCTKSTTYVDCWILTPSN